MYGKNLFYLGIFALELEKTTVLWNVTSAPSNTSKHKISFKNKNPEIWDQIVGWNFKKTNVVFEISILECVNMQNFIQKQKIFKLGTKNTLFRCFWTAI